MQLSSAVIVEAAAATNVYHLRGSSFWLAESVYFKARDGNVGDGDSRAYTKRYND